MLSARQAIEVASLDAMDELGRFARNRDQIIPPPGAHRRFDSQYSVGDRIAVVVVIEKPPVQLLFMQRCSNSVQIHLGLLRQK